MGHKTLSIGGATYDLFVGIPKEYVAKDFTFPAGEKVRVEDVTETCGGGASNTSVGLSRLGCTACFEGIISSDQWGEKLLENLKNEGVNTDCVAVVEDEVSSFSVILSGHDGERVILYESGTNTHLHDANFNKDLLSEMDWVYLNHIQEGSCVIQDDIVEMLTGDSTPCLTWNPGGCQIDLGLEAHAALLQNTDLLLLNKEEALKFTRKEHIEDALRSCVNAGASNVCITDGKHGVVASDGKQIFRCPTIPTEIIVDTTGAGDAFGTGVTWGLLEGMTLPEALKTGSINASSVVSAIGAQTALLTDTEIRKRLKECTLTVSVDPF